MEQSSKTLTFVVPAYNMETYLERCVESLLSATDNSDIEVLIVDDGSSDGTPELADMYERRWPGNVRAIHQVNKGHGGAVNTGIANATGMYVKVVDADDWVDMPSIDTLMGTLRVQRVATDPVDMIVTNYVYDKVGKRVKHTVNFRHAMAANTVLGWDDLGCFGVAEYILMHALIYRTQVVRDSGMQLPEHTFYVDFIYAYQPFPWGQVDAVHGHPVLPLLHRARGAERTDRRDDPPRRAAAARQPAHGGGHSRTGNRAGRPIPLYDSFPRDRKLGHVGIPDPVERQGKLPSQGRTVGGHRQGVAGHRA